MSLSTMTGVTGGSVAGFTGGSTIQFACVGVTANRMELVVEADTPLTSRRRVVIIVVPPNPNAAAPNGYSQARSIFRFIKPKLLANGKTVANTAELKVSFDPETTQAEVQEMLDIIAQAAAINADTRRMFKSQILNG